LAGLRHAGRGFSWELNMRLTVLILAGLLCSGPAAAQNWQEYSNPDQFFTITFPGDPQIETTMFPVADDRSVEAHVYSVSQDGAVFKVTVADLADTGLEEGAVIDHAIKTLSEGSEVKVNIPHRVNRVFGRQLSIAGPDRIRSMIAVFYYQSRLYQIEGKSVSTENDAAAIRFVQSLVFTGGGSNRSADEIRAARAACRGAGAPEIAGVPGAGAQDTARCHERHRRQRGGG
jgi:hypothetical protein